jgi:hypothetical protein
MRKIRGKQARWWTTVDDFSLSVAPNAFIPRSSAGRWATMPHRCNSMETAEFD